MRRALPIKLRRAIVVAATAALPAACDESTPLQPEAAAPDAGATLGVRPGGLPLAAQTSRALAALRRATARYHDLDAALADGFVFLHGCEVRPDEGPVGAIYVHPARLDGVLDPSSPEGLVYEPTDDGGLRLVGAELVIPYPFWTGTEPPNFLGATFQREDEFGVFGLHVWIWRHNPAGMFAETNPRISCDAE